MEISSRRWETSPHSLPHTSPAAPLRHLHSLPHCGALRRRMLPGPEGPGHAQLRDTHGALPPAARTGREAQHISRQCATTCLLYFHSWHAQAWPQNLILGRCKCKRKNPCHFFTHMRIVERRRSATTSRQPSKAAPVSCAARRSTMVCSASCGEGIVGGEKGDLYSTFWTNTLPGGLLANQSVPLPPIAASLLRFL